MNLAGKWPHTRSNPVNVAVITAKTKCWGTFGSKAEGISQHRTIIVAQAAPFHGHIPYEELCSSKTAVTCFSLHMARKGANSRGCYGCKVKNEDSTTHLSANSTCCILYCLLVCSPEGKVQVNHWSARAKWNEVCAYLQRRGLFHDPPLKP